MATTTVGTNTTTTRTYKNGQNKALYWAIGIAVALVIAIAFAIKRPAEAPVTPAATTTTTTESTTTDTMMENNAAATEGTRDSSAVQPVDPTLNNQQVLENPSDPNANPTDTTR